MRALVVAVVAALAVMASVVLVDDRRPRDLRASPEARVASAEQEASGAPSAPTWRESVQEPSPSVGTSDPAAEAATPVAPRRRGSPLEATLKLPLPPSRSPRREIGRAYPDAVTTGVRPGTVLVASGPLTIAEAGAVYSDLDVDGCILVRAPNVVIKNSRIRCADARYAVTMRNDASNLLLEDVELDGRGMVGVAICCDSFILRRGDVHDVVDGPRLVSGSVVEDSWIHHLSRSEGSHNDTLQSTGGSNIIVRRNRLEPWNPDTRDPFNAALMLGSTTEDELRDVLVEDNYLNGGNFTVNVHDDTVANGVVFRRNTWGRDHLYGPVAGMQPGVQLGQDNVYLDDGSPVGP